jgi:hypothetical protein
MPITSIITIRSKSGLTVRAIHVERKFVEVVGALSVDKAIRDLAAYGSAALSDFDA